MQVTENERLKIFRKELKQTQMRFGEVCNIKQGSYADVERGKVKVSGDIKAALSKEFSLNVDWLESGEGDMFLSDRKQNLRLEAKPLRLADPFGYEATGEKIYELNDQSLIMEVPIVSERASAGYLRGFADKEFYEDLPTIPVMIDKKAFSTYLGFEVIGDSMVCLDNYELAEKSIFPGRIAVGRFLEKSKWKYKLHIHNYDAWIIVHKVEGILIKAITNHDLDANTITIHSLNPDYEDEVFNLEDIEQIFSVVKVEQKTR